LIIAALILLGCWVYCVLAILGAYRYSSAPNRPAAGDLAAISVLKPLSGLDEGLEENLRSYFEQDYERFELLFAVRHNWDPAAAVVRRLQSEYPHVRSTLLVTGEPPYPHAKVFSLQSMLDIASYELIAMGDSDVRVGPDFCQRLAAEFCDSSLGLLTCPYRAVGGSTVWSRLEALGMNTDFHAGLFTAVLMEGTKFAVGPTIVARRSVLDALGGMERFKDYLAEDYMLGRVASDLGFGVGFSSYVVEHRIGSEAMLPNFLHRLRWARSSRRSRPWGYVGQFFTHPVPLALLAGALYPALLPTLFITCALRVISAQLVANRILKAGISWFWLPVQDLMGFAFWIAGFFGNSIHWRGQRYRINRDGTLEQAA
jgi:ceramide glucosyltransferase